MADDLATRSGWITFAGVAALIAGAYNTLSEIAALSDDWSLVTTPPPSISARSRPFASSSRRIAAA
jgi:hypothetical protein